MAGLFWIALALAALLVLTRLIYDFSALKVTHVALEHPKIAAPVRICHLSDLHTRSFGRGNRRLQQKVAALAPDLICMTGDMADRRRKNARFVRETTRTLTAIAPLYYVSGNHDTYVNKRKSRLFGAVQVRAGGGEAPGRTERVVHIGRTPIGISALSDDDDKDAALIARARRLRFKGEAFHLFLCHKPEIYPQIADIGFDLMLSGHAHGGQIRLPGLPALVAPGQGFLPRYVGGLYQEGRGAMALSRGLGASSRMPFRFWNPPEILCITLQPSKKEDKGC